MCLDPDVMPPLAGFRLFAVLGFSTMFSLCLLYRYAFLKLLTVFNLFIAPGNMFKASTTLRRNFSFVLFLAAEGSAQ
jgi:hypothetical protein